jgi:hypothetical protein
MTDDPGSGDARRAAIERIKSRKAFWTQVWTFLATSIVLIVIWLVAGRGFFWPIFPIIAFAIALGSQARGVFSRGITETEIQREMNRRPR